jgi:hypothetical protein
MDDVDAPLGGLREDAEEPERAFNYPELPERVMTFKELLDKCGYDEEVVAQYADVGDIEVRLHLKLHANVPGP